MTRKHWIATQLQNQASEEDQETAGRMLDVANHLRKCGSSTVWDVAMRGYRSRLKTNPNATKPDVEEYVEWRGENSDDGKLAILGLARCKRIQCPVCCYTRTFLRRNLALEWAQDVDWSEYYAVMLTFTVSHTLADSENKKSFLKKLDQLSLSVKRFSQWFRDLSSTNRGYKSPTPDDLGFISSLEFTFGKNGLHPHFHTIFLTKSGTDLDKLREFFRKDRVRVWREAGGSLLRMPDYNEDESFKIFLTPGESVAKEKMLSYVSKGLFEALSSVTKDTSKEETSKSIFQLSGHELKYFCTFFEATKGKRFYRAGGVCKEIMGVKEALEDKKVEENIRSTFESIFKISAGSDIPDGWVSEFISHNKSDFERILPQLSAPAIKKTVTEKWGKFVKNKVQKMTFAFAK